MLPGPREAYAGTAMLSYPREAYAGTAMLPSAREAYAMLFDGNHQTETCAC
jgi:hypothetical protein